MGKWKTLKSKIIYENPWIKLREDDVIRPDGSDGIFSFVEIHDEVVIIVPLDEDNNIYIIKIDRYPVDGETWEFPMGHADGEDHLTAAKRELQEETGLLTNELTYLGATYPLGGLSTEVNHIYLARQLTAGLADGAEEEGINELKKVSIDELKQMIQNGEFMDGQSNTALLRVLLFLEQEK